MELRRFDSSNWYYTITHCIIIRISIPVQTLITFIQLSCVVNIQAEEIKYNSEGLVFFNKGNNYLMGDGVPENHAKGINFIRKAAELNNIGGQVFLGMMYSSGRIEGIGKDYDEAKKWFVKAIEQELPVDALAEPSFKAEFTELKGLAQLNLGMMYHKGLGVTKDYIKAKEFYEKSAENGNGKASSAFWQLVKDIKISQERASIKSPDGLFLVSSKNVSEIKVTGSPNKNGYYPYDLISVRSIFSNHVKKGDITARGWWYPDTQQFNSKSWRILPKSPKCNSWEKANWSFSYAPIPIELNGIKIRVWKERNNDPNSRKPESLCAIASTNIYTCERVRCKRWDRPKANTYIVKSKSEALNLFNRLN